MPGPRARAAEEALQATERAALARDQRLRDLVGINREQLEDTVRASEVVSLAMANLREQFARVAERFALQASSGFPSEADTVEQRLTQRLARGAGWDGRIVNTRPAEFLPDRCTCDECRENERMADQMGRAQAGRRAEQLLLSWLNEEQARSYRNGDGFVVKGASGTSYRVWVAYEAPTYVLDGPYAGSEVCVQLHPNYHPADAALARKLLIETDEPAFLSVANGLRAATGLAPQIQMSNPRVEVVRDEGDQIVYRVLLDVENVTVDRVVERQ